VAGRKRGRLIREARARYKKFFFFDARGRAPTLHITPERHLSLQNTRGYVMQRGVWGVGEECALGLEMGRGRCQLDPGNPPVVAVSFEAIW
jgi:hypothetical protein